MINLKVKKEQKKKIKKKRKWYAESEKDNESVKEKAVVDPKEKRERTKKNPCNLDFSILRVFIFHLILHLFILKLPSIH